MVSAAWGVPLDAYDEVREVFDTALVSDPTMVPAKQEAIMSALGISGA